MAPSSSSQPTDKQQAALQRLLDVKGPVRRQRRDEQPFLLALDDLLKDASAMEENKEGWLGGSMSGQRWQNFLETMHNDLFSHLRRYHDEAHKTDFSPASLATLKEERKKIERLYIRDLVALYSQAMQTYKTLSG